MFNTLLVDDERLARAELRRLLSPYPQITIQAEASTAEQALELMQQQVLLLLMIQHSASHYYDLLCRYLVC